MNWVEGSVVRRMKGHEDQLIEESSLYILALLKMIRNKI